MQLFVHQVVLIVVLFLFYRIFYCHILKLGWMSSVTMKCTETKKMELLTLKNNYTVRAPAHKKGPDQKQ